MSSAGAWAILGLFAAALIGGVAWLIARRRRRAADTFDYDETVYQEHPVEHQPVIQEPIEQPAAAAMLPAAATEVEARRPWIDIGLRPLHAAEDGALAVELTLSNSGDAEAHDVRVSTWMLDGARSSDNEQGLIEAHHDAQVTTLDIAPGDDRAVETVLPVSATDGTPLLVAEARYPLADGSEGRIAAAFELETNGTDVEARLHEVIERA